MLTCVGMSHVRVSTTPAAMQTIKYWRIELIYIEDIASQKCNCRIRIEILHLMLVGCQRPLLCIMLTFASTSNPFTPIVIFSGSFWQRFSLLLVILCQILILPNFNWGLINKWTDMKCWLLHQSMEMMKLMQCAEDINIRHTTIYPILSPLP